MGERPSSIFPKTYRTRIPDEGSVTLAGPLRKRVDEAVQPPGATRDQMKTSTQERWAEWQRLLDAGTYSTKAELTRAEGVSRAAVTRALQRLRRSR